LIDPQESLQEEIYCNTLHFFDVLGREARGPSLDYIGRVIPVVRPRADGKAVKARITFTGFATDRPAVVVSYHERNGHAGEGRHAEGRTRAARQTCARGGCGSPNHVGGSGRGDCGEPESTPDSRLVQGCAGLPRSRHAADRGRVELDARPIDPDNLRARSER